MLIDIGANLGHVSFSRDLHQVIATAQDAGIAHIIVTGTDVASVEHAQILCEQYPHYLSMTAGYHPHLAASCNNGAFQQIRDFAALSQVVAVGETGLDFNRDYSPRDIQEKVFAEHLALAADLQKPLFLHQRDAHRRFYPILKEHRDRLTGGVVHCFTDTREALEDYLDLDMHIGVTGWVCDERRGLELQQLLRYIPADRLLLETDAPYLLPRSLKPKPATRRNEPRHLTEVLRKVADYSDRSMTAVAAQTTANALKLFDLAL
ncbi:MAG: TatD family hydrolase [Pseudohongiellaceae bacterium]